MTVRLIKDLRTSMQYGAPVIHGTYWCCGDWCYAEVYVVAEAVQTSGHGDRATMAALSGACVCSTVVEEVMTEWGRAGRLP